MVFVVREGNPKNIRDWSDLIRADVSVITANPKTSGAARWIYLAAWAWAMAESDGDEAGAREYITALYRNVPVLDTAARGATTTFAQNRIGDVLLNWENEALLLAEDWGREVFEVVVPSRSILAETPVAWIDRNVERRGTRNLAEAYLRFLYTPEVQEMAARHHYRPRDPEVMERVRDRFPEVSMFTIEDVFGSWEAAHNTHFADGGIFDQIYSR